MALQREYTDQVCSVARALEVVGERWTLLVIRDVLLGVRRFEQLAQSVGTTPAMLTRRLRALVAEGVLERRRYQDRPERFEYHPTAKGRELFGVITTLMQWGDRHYGPDGPPRTLIHQACGQPMDPRITCACCGDQVQLGDVVAQPGPGVVPAHPSKP